MLNQIYTDENYAYASTTSGLDIYDIVSESKYAYINHDNGFNTVWANDSKVFVGTTNSGIKYVNKTCISGSITDPIDLYTCLNNFSDLTYYHNLTSDNIQYLHGSGDIICAVTNSGVDVVKLDPQSYRSYTTISGGQKCFMTSTGKFYYTLISGTVWSLNRVNYCLWDWSEPDKAYITGGGIFEAGISLNDVFVTENTSSTTIDNTLFVATSSGIYVIDEETENYNIYYKE